MRAVNDLLVAYSEFSCFFLQKRRRRSIIPYELYFIVNIRGMIEKEQGENAINHLPLAISRVLLLQKGGD